jgi:hypothetical protein
MAITAGLREPHPAFFDDNSGGQERAPDARKDQFPVGNGGLHRRSPIGRRVFFMG